jgi:hypothetical protein
MRLCSLVSSSRAGFGAGVTVFWRTNCDIGGLWTETVDVLDGGGLTRVIVDPAVGLDGPALLAKGLLGPAFDALAWCGKGRTGAPIALTGMDELPLAPCGGGTLARSGSFPLPGGATIILFITGLEAAFLAAVAS